MKPSKIASAFIADMRAHDKRWAELDLEAADEDERKWSTIYKHVAIFVESSHKPPADRVVVFHFQKIGAWNIGRVERTIREKHFGSKNGKYDWYWSDKKYWTDLYVDEKINLYFKNPKGLLKRIASCLNRPLPETIELDYKVADAVKAKYTL